MLYPIELRARGHPSIKWGNEKRYAIENKSITLMETS